LYLKNQRVEGTHISTQYIHPIQRIFILTQVYGKGQMTDLGRILFSEQCEREIKERWPDVCHECGCVAWTGLIHVHCVNAACRLGSEENASEYHDLLASHDHEPGPKLNLPTLDDLMPSTITWPNPLPPAPPPYDWGTHVENNPHTSVNAKGNEWTYRLPVGKCRTLYIGDYYTSSNGIRYCICALDRTTEEITIMMDPRP
jgi:hypothetical protein